MAKNLLQKTITDDLDALLEALPPHISEPIGLREDHSDLLEVVMDLGRKPEARYPHFELVLTNKEVVQDDLDYVVSRISAFGDDNRAGIERTLHRISAIRNRKGRIVGLTCRVGRAVFGTIKIIEDLVQSGKSILLLGRPGVGKTTMLREVARVLADDMQKRVVIVDTSNEIAGDGDIPHPAIGHARRMQVPTPTMQHAVMIEAVENHMPEVIVIDEIGTELEALAARTIAERGVQLVGTAHGNTLENLVMNPTLADLIGGIQSVTLGDEEARRRGTQKSILERKAPPTFHMVVEIQSWERVAIHPDVAQVVDSLLRGQNISPEIRWLDEEGNIQIERTAAVRGFGQPVERVEREPHGSSAKIYPFGVSRDRLNEAIRRLQLPMQVVDDLRLADVLITVRNYYRRKPQALRDAEARGVPIYVLKSNTAIQTELCLTDIARAGTRENPVQDAMQEAEEAIDKVMQGHSAVELQPQNAYIRRLQHLMASRYNLPTESYGKEPFRRVRILRSDHDEEDE